MKLNEILNEMPYLIKGEYPAPKYIEEDTFISSQSLEREYTKLVSKAIDGVNVDFWYLKKGTSVIGVIEKKKDKVDSNLIIFSLRFKLKNTIKNAPSELKGKIGLQVDGVFTQQDFRSRSLASIVYYSLVKKGYVIISDTGQFDGGQGLWKKLAKDSVHADYKVYVLHDSGEFIKTDAGDKKEYNGSNIPDNEIWSQGQELYGDNILLVMV